jgi:hypothetical protein
MATDTVTPGARLSCQPLHPAGHAVQYAFLGSFIGQLRDEMLSETLLSLLAQSVPCLQLGESTTTLTIIPSAAGWRVNT